MGQISKGTTFITGQRVDAANLNNLVDNATLLPTAITAQTLASTVADTNLLLTTPSSGASLNKISLSTIVTSLSLAKTTGNQSFSGNLTMVSGADIALTSQSILSLPAGATQTLASGSSLTLSSGAILTLGQNPIASMQAVTKTYADTNFLKGTGGTVTGPLNVSGAMICSNDITMIGTGSVLTLSADPITDLSAATKRYVDTKITSASFIKAFARFRSIDQPGTYTRLDNTVTVTINNHGMQTGQHAYMQFTGGATSGYYQITKTGNNTFTVQDTASGTIATNPAIREIHNTNSYNVQSIQKTETGKYTINFTDGIAAGGYCVSGLAAISDTYPLPSNGGQIEVYNQQITSVQIATATSNGSSYTDCRMISIIIVDE